MPLVLLWPLLVLHTYLEVLSPYVAILARLLGFWLRPVAFYIPTFIDIKAVIYAPASGIK